MDNRLSVAGMRPSAAPGAWRPRGRTAAAQRVTACPRCWRRPAGRVHSRSLSASIKKPLPPAWKNTGGR